MILRNSIFLTTVLLALSIHDVAAQLNDAVADRMLVYQRSTGGWPKFLYDKARKEVKVDYNRELTLAETSAIRADSLATDATYDNNATSREIRYLADAYKRTQNKKYLAAAEKGIRYILKGQYKSNGGWPQFYPLRKGYSSHITYNDNAMVNNLNILQDVVNKTNNMEIVSASLAPPSQRAIDRAIRCILATQVKVNGKLTAWCAQHDTVRLKPANARAFELASLSGSESVGLVRFLMRQKDPSPEIRQAIIGAMSWLETSKIAGYRFAKVEGASYESSKDMALIADASATTWARFYDLDTNEPFFCGRDGIKKKNVADIDYERRNGYAWYGTWPEKLIAVDFPAWKAANKIP